MVEDINPDRILNLNFSVTHIRPLSGKWYLIATLGGGIYAEPDAIVARSLLANGGAIFVYRLRKNLDVGIGVGLTNSFGVPIIMPMSFINWKSAGNFEINVNVSSGMEISASTRLKDRLKVKLVGIEMDGMSAVMDVEGKSMIYASTSMKSYLSPELKIGKLSTLYIDAGGTWTRSVNFTKRSFKGFIDNFKNNRKLNFGTTGYLAVGFRYGF